LLDEYLEREYDVDSRFGWYEILVAR